MSSEFKFKSIRGMTTRQITKKFLRG
uniref:Uncharacterized protein n=1 Tax=Rhizophora mucronata TaxID=61149 RepID=A0A2P2PQJ7_RHIMU